MVLYLLRLEKWRFSFPRLQDEIQVIRRYEGLYYTKLQSHVIFYLESRIYPLPSTIDSSQDYTIIYALLK